MSLDSVARLEAMAKQRILEADDDPVIDDAYMRFDPLKHAVPEGVKADDGKAPMHLIPPEAMHALANRLRLGAKKYDARNWEKGIAYSRVHSALLRHLFAWWSGEDIDPDPTAEGSSHLEGVLINAAFLVAFEKRFGAGSRFDDRPGTTTG